MSLPRTIKGKDSTGNERIVATDSNGNLIVVGSGTLAVQNTPAAFSFLNVTASIASTVAKSSAGTLHSIVMNSAAAAGNTTTIYDSAVGANSTIAFIAATTATVPTTLIFDVAFLNGLSIVTTVANGGDMTISYI